MNQTQNKEDFSLSPLPPPPHPNPLSLSLSHWKLLIGKVECFSFKVVDSMEIHQFSGCESASLMTCLSLLVHQVTHLLYITL